MHDVLVYSYDLARLSLTTVGLLFRFTFVAQFENELSLNEGDMVYLKRYVDCEWLEGEIDGENFQGLYSA